MREPANRRLLIDALYINISGGKVLLDYLIECLENTNLEIFYLFDQRIVNKHPKIKDGNKVTYLKAGLLSRARFYRTNSESFYKIFCFGNLPPLQNCAVESLTYFHQTLFIEIPESISILDKVIINFKMMILNKLKGNTTKWIVQSESIKMGLCKKYKLEKESVIVLPFYPPLPAFNKFSKIDNSFVYISNVGPHKNHDRLIEGFCNFYDKYKIGDLGLTIGDDYTSEISLISNLKKKGYPITNYGFIERDRLAEIYSKAEYLIFPSLAESFGLGIVEAIDSGCKVIGANLPYTFEICDPSIIFEPLSVESIELAFTQAIKKEPKPTVKKVTNQIENLINLLS